MTGSIVIHKFLSFASASATTLKSKGILLWRILTFSPADETIFPQKSLCISIEKGSISLALGTRLLSRVRIKGLRRYSFEGERFPPPDGLASSVALAINELRASKADVILSIPKAWAVIKTAEFPSTVKEALSDVVSYELDRLTPFAPEDALYDLRILKDDAGSVTLLVIAARADVIKPYLDALREKGIQVSRVTVNLSGIGTLCNFIDRYRDSLFAEIHENGYEGALFLNSSPAGSFTGSFTEAEETSKVDTLIKEFAPLIEVSQKQGGSPQIIFLLKDKSPGLKELLKLRIDLPVRILNETDIKLMLPGPPSEIPYAAIGGVLESLWPKAKGLNLLKKGQYKRPKIPVTLSVILLLALSILWILYLIAPLKIEGKRLKEVDHQIMIRKEEVKKVEALKKEIEALKGEILTIETFKGSRPMALDIFRELTNLLPKNTWLTRMRITETTVDIEGYADSATGLIPKLEASKYFRKAEFASPTFRDAKLNAERFVIKVELEGIQRKEKGSKDEEE